MTDLERFKSFFDEMKVTYEMCQAMGVLPEEIFRYIKLGSAYILFDEHESYISVSTLPAARDRVRLAETVIKCLTPAERIEQINRYCPHCGIACEEEAKSTHRCSPDDILR